MREVLNAVQAGEAAEGSVEGVFPCERNEVFGWEDAEVWRVGQRCLRGPVLREFDHPRGDLAGHEVDSFAREKDCVDAGAAAQFEDSLAGFEDTLEVTPYCVAARASDGGSAEVLLVGFRSRVPVDLSVVKRVGVETD